ncbi:MAG: hypothetical protein KAR19_03655 [Bacteroidales bacterium]|nr:hypothetical protein [Bacteroidales bacterium]
MNNLHLQYKRETGCSVKEWEFGVIRSRGQWILDPSEVDDQFVLEQLTGYSGRILIPDLEYIAWLEEQLQNLLLHGKFPQK